MIGPPVPREAGDQHRGSVHGGDVRRADRDRAEPAGEEHRRASNRTDDQWLQEASLGVAAHDAERQEDGEDDAEEQRRKHRQPEDGRADECAGVDPLRRRDGEQIPEGVVVGEPEERQEPEGQQ